MIHLPVGLEKPAWDVHAILAHGLRRSTSELGSSVRVERLLQPVALGPCKGARDIVM